MLKRANINWTARQLAKMVEKRSIVFDNAVQRGHVWDNERKSLLIHSMIVGYPIPPFYAKKTEDGIYDCLDGKQRSSAITDFMMGKYKLTDLPEVPTEDEQLIDISGMDFESLPDNFKDEITGYSLTVYYFDDITDDEVSEMFFRLNNGKPLTAIELTRVKAKSIEVIQDLGRHDIFLDALTEKAMNRYTNEDIVIKSYAILFTENPSLETKKIRPFMESVEITEEQKHDIQTAFTRLLETFREIKNISVPDDQERKLRDKVAKRMLGRTHLITLVPVALKSVNDEVSVGNFAKWVYRFYSGGRAATINDNYNACASAGSARAEAVQTRLTAAMTDYQDFIKTTEE